MHEPTFSTVSVYGLGYIGLPTAVFIARQGIRVIGVDVDEERVAMVNSGISPFSEPGFDDALTEVVQTRMLTAQTGAPAADVHIIAVPTPFGEDHAINMTYIEAAGRAIAPELHPGNLVILESTSPPGTTRNVADQILALRPDLTLEQGQENTIHFAHAPERVLPGRIMVEMVENDRVVGGLTDEAGIITKELYATFCEGEILTTDAKTAEMVKLAENTYRDVNIAYANELSMIADTVGVDVWELIRLANHHPRVNILQPGPGVGGHCIAVDPWFLVSAAPDESRLIRVAREVNDSKPEFVAQKIREDIAHIPHPKIALFGLTFKPDIADTRNSPAIRIAQILSQSPTSRIYAVDPFLKTLPPELEIQGNVELVDTSQALKLADIGIVLVPHTTLHAELLHTKQTPDLLKGENIIAHQKFK